MMLVVVVVSWSVWVARVVDVVVTLEVEVSTTVVATGVGIMVLVTVRVWTSVIVRAQYGMVSVVGLRVVYTVLVLGASVLVPGSECQYCGSNDSA
jgi:hypothetical protein